LGSLVRTLRDLVKEQVVTFGIDPQSEAMGCGHIEREREKCKWCLNNEPCLYLGHIYLLLISDNTSG
jgi:hypothetical protein